MTIILGALDTDEQTSPSGHDSELGKSNSTPLSLGLIAKKIPIKFSEYRISTISNKMMPSETVSISDRGILFYSQLPFPTGNLMRIWIELPEYWARKSRHVGYLHTEAPTFFQVLSRVVSNELSTKRSWRHQIFCENVNLDPIDEKVLKDFLGIGA